jgi:hypothetical protein
MAWSVSAVCHGVHMENGDTRVTRVQGCPDVTLDLVTIYSPIAGSCGPCCSSC